MSFMSHLSMPRCLPRCLIVVGFALYALLLSLTPVAMAQEPPPLSPGKQFVAKEGSQIYQTSCQGCHMANGKGAQGAAAYPSLAGNTNLAVPEYLIFVILNGKNGMPGFRDSMSDEQIANVANHVRSSFGNRHGPEVTADFVKDFAAKSSK